MTEDTNPQQRPEADEAWLAELADASVEPDRPTSTGSEADSVASPGLDSVVPAYLPPLDRERPDRTPLVPRWALITTIVTVVAIVVVVSLTLVVGSLRQVAVPEVTGIAVSEAEARLQAAGLGANVTERRFSTESEGMVLAQDPVTGVELTKGDTVNLVVSAGSEDFTMLDVIGSTAAGATAALESKGLVVTVETLVSTAPPGTVLASTPSPGTVVRTGDRVVLQVAGSSAPGVVLQPYSLTGVSVVIDAAVPMSGATDIAMEVGRRLGALLEASGASVVLLRSKSDTRTSEAERAQRAAESTASVAIGFGVSSDRAAGRVVQFPSQGTAQAIAASSLLASSVTSELAVAAPPATSDASPSDAVLGASRGPWVRVLLGSQVAREDQTLFADPNWADKIARAVYTAVGKSYGVVQQP